MVSFAPQDVSLPHYCNAIAGARLISDPLPYGMHHRMSFYPENEALTVRLWENRRTYACGGVAELADAADLKSASSECGFESHRPYQKKPSNPARHRIVGSTVPIFLPAIEPEIEEIELVWKL